MVFRITGEGRELNIGVGDVGWAFPVSSCLLPTSIFTYLRYCTNANGINPPSTAMRHTKHIHTTAWIRMIYLQQELEFHMLCPSLLTGLPSKCSNRKVERYRASESRGIQLSCLCNRKASARHMLRRRHWTPEKFI